MHAAGTGADSFTWTPTIPAGGSYQVYARWTAHPNRSTHATYTVNHAAGATAVTVNQEADGGRRQLLGTFTLDAGTTNNVVLIDQGDGYVIADAIKVVPAGAAPNSATWTPTIPVAKAYRVYARWTAHPNWATNVQYTVTHAGGDTVVAVNQQQNSGAWTLLGTFNMAPGQGHKVSVTDQADGYVIADAIRLIGTDDPEFDGATWTPNVSGQYEVYAKWTANANRASNATYTMSRAAGSTPIAVNQQANGGQFNLLGTFSLTAASTIALTDNANGYVIADAVQLIATGPVQAQLYFIYSDQLNTPRLITNQTQQAVWTWANDDPFGNNAPNENPSSLGTFTCNLRLPGQYFDKETNTHYNYFRDYDPAIGRYVQSDPIGLAEDQHICLRRVKSAFLVDLHGKGQLDPGLIGTLIERLTESGQSAVNESIGTQIGAAIGVGLQGAATGIGCDTLCGAKCIQIFTRVWGNRSIVPVPFALQEMISSCTGACTRKCNACR